MRTRIVRVAVAAMLVGCRHGARGPGAGFAEGATAIIPERFAPGVVSGENVWKGSFTPDGDTLYYFRHLAGGAESYGIFTSHRERGGGWSAPQRVTLGGEWSDLYPAISPDGRLLVFTSYRPVPGDPSSHPNASLWVTWRERKGTWATPRPLGLGIPGQYHSQTAFDAEGSLYYSVANPGERMDPVYVARWNGHGFEPPVAYSPVDHWVHDIGEDTLYVWGGRPTPDGRAVILEVSRIDERRRPGPADLWMSCSGPRGWSVPRPLPDSVNTAGNENFIFFAPKGRRMFFVRDFRELLSIPAPRDCDALPVGQVGAMALPAARPAP